MATDPTRSIRRHEHPSTFDHSAADLLDRLAALPAQSDVPYLTVTLDWTIAGESPGRREAEDVKRSQIASEDGGSERPALREMEVTLDRLIDEHGPRGDTFDALQASKDRISAWLREELDPMAQGVYIVSHEPSGTFEATGLTLPIDTHISLSPMPRIYKLVRVIEDHPTYAVLQADQNEATLSFITTGDREGSVELESSLYPRKQKQGGWSQRRFQARADERVEAFARDIMDEVQVAMREGSVETLILAGNEVMMSALDQMMSDQVRALVFETVRMEPTVTSQEKIDQTQPIAEAAEREEEMRSVERVLSGIGNDMGVGGKHDTIRALQNGQVELLVMADTFDGQGWADYEMQVFGAGNLPTEHPLGGEVTHLTPVDLKDELVRLALATGATVDIIHSPVPVDPNADVPQADGEIPISEAAGKLVELGGVGAVLRYAMSGDAESQTV